MVRPVWFADTWQVWWLRLQIWMASSPIKNIRDLENVQIVSQPLGLPVYVAGSMLPFIFWKSILLLRRYCRAGMPTIGSARNTRWIQIQFKRLELCGCFGLHEKSAMFIRQFWAWFSNNTMTLSLSMLSCFRHSVIQATSACLPRSFVVLDLGLKILKLFWWLCQKPNTPIQQAWPGAAQ